MKDVAKRIFIAASALLVWYFGVHHLKPWAARLFQPLAPTAPGLALMFGHVFIYTFPVALICGLWWLVLIGLGYVPRLQLRANWRAALSTATLSAVVAAAATLAIVPPLYGMPLAFKFNGYGIAGNFFSNAWEEIVYRGLLFQALAVSTRSQVAGAVISSALFALTHDQYPLGLQVYVGLIGFLMCVVFLRTRNFLAPVWMHDVLDWIVDLFL